MGKHILLITGILFLILQGCSTDEEIPIQVNNNSNLKSTLPSYEEQEKPRTIKSKNKIVVRYISNLTPSQKDEIRNENQVIHYEKCSCGDDFLELWTIDHTEISVEEAVNNLAEDGDVEGDYQFNVFIKRGYHNNPKPSSSMRSMIAPPGAGTTVDIGVIDSGVDYDYFPKPFLYYSGANGCRNELSGWDFVNGDYDIRDDHGHGTWVTKLITSELNKSRIHHRILAAKVFDKKGKGSYWNLVCAMNYMTKKSPPMDIINMSFGWYDITGQGILKKMMDSVKNTTLFISSAGNAGVNTDEGIDPHFPSGFDLINTIAVGGYKPGPVTITPNGNILGVELDKGSNYGKHSIDMVTSFGPYKIKLEPKNELPLFKTVSGTSFSSAYTTSRAAKLFSNGTTHPIFLKIGLSMETYSSEVLKDRIVEGKVLLKSQ